MLDLKLSNSVEWLARKPRGCSCLCFHPAGITGTPCPQLTFYPCVGDPNPGPLVICPPPPLCSTFTSITWFVEIHQRSVAFREENSIENSFYYVHLNVSLRLFVCGEGARTCPAHTWRSEDSVWGSVLSFHRVAGSSVAMVAV